MRLSFSWQHSDDGLASRHLISGLDPHLRLLWQVEVHARPEPDQPVPLAPCDPLAFREPADDAPRHVPSHLHAQHAMSGVRLEQRRHLLVRQRRLWPARHRNLPGLYATAFTSPAHGVRLMCTSSGLRKMLTRTARALRNRGSSAAATASPRPSPGETTRLAPSGTRRGGLRKNHPVKSTTAPNNDPAAVQPNTHAATAGTPASARKGSPSRAIGQPRARSAIDQFLVLSTSWSFLSQGIMARNRAPTSSIGCCSPRLSRALYWGRLAWHSRIHSLANRAVWVSSC